MISLVLATRGRYSEVSALLESIVSQDYDVRGIELIVVDQNASGHLDPVLRAYSTTLNILHVLDPGRGLSRARNIGLGHCSGDIVAFPDDDCTYVRGVFNFVRDFFTANAAVDILSIATAETLHSSRSLIVQSPYPHPITPENIRGCSITFFFRRAKDLATLRFDENLGVGAPSPYQGGEEEDFVIRALAGGAVGLYLPSVLVLHPVKEHGHSMATLWRRYRIAAGRGYCLHANRLAYRKDHYLSRVLLYWAKPALAVSRPLRLLPALFECFGFYRGIFGSIAKGPARGERG